jgi:hypothetical protein
MTSLLIATPGQLVNEAVSAATQSRKRSTVCIRRGPRGKTVMKDAEFGQVTDVLAGFGRTAGQRHPVHEVVRERLGRAGRLLELPAGVAAAHLLHELGGQPGDLAVHRRGLREPGGDGAGRGERGLLVVVVDRAIGEDGDLGPRVTARLLGAAVDVVQGEADAVRVQPGQQDDAVRDPARQLERLRAGRRHPDGDVRGGREAVVRVVQRERRRLGGDVLPGPQRPDHLDRLLQVGQPGRA